MVPKEVGAIRIFGSSKFKGVVNPDIDEKVKIGFRGKSAGKFTLRIFTTLGELVYQDTKILEATSGVFEWFPRDIASGVYILHIEGPGIKAYEKTAIIR